MQKFCILAIKLAYLADNPEDRVFRVDGKYFFFGPNQVGRYHCTQENAEKGSLFFFSESSPCCISN